MYSSFLGICLLEGKISDHIQCTYWCSFENDRERSSKFKMYGTCIFDLFKAGDFFGTLLYIFTFLKVN